MSNASDTNASNGSESTRSVSDANPDQPALATGVNPAMEMGALPVLFRGTVYTQPLSAHLAALFDQLDVQYTYHRHRLLVDTQEHAILPEFWLPQTNTFLFVYSAWPNYEQCVEHESIAKLGHSVTVLVGKQLATAVACAKPSVACAKPLREGEDVMHGWTLEYLTGELRPGWTAFMLVDGRVQLSNMVFPADRRAVHTSVVRALESARKAVDDSKKVPEGLSFAPEGLSFAPEGLSFAPEGLRCSPEGSDTDNELSHTLGKSLKFK
jgi:hypothetical protein